MSKITYPKLAQSLIGLGMAIQRAGLPAESAEDIIARVLQCVASADIDALWVLGQTYPSVEDALRDFRIIACIVPWLRDDAPDHVAFEIEKEGK